MEVVKADEFQLCYEARALCADMGPTSGLVNISIQKHGTTTTLSEPEIKFARIKCRRNIAQNTNGKSFQILLDITMRGRR
jgi:hypothetical protein